MDPGQPIAGLLGRGDRWAMNSAVMQAAEGRQGIGKDNVLGHQSTLSEISDVGIVYLAHRLHHQKAPSLAPVLTSNQNRRFSFRAPAALSRAFAPNQCIIEFQPLVQSIEAIAMPHSNAQLAQYPVGLGQEIASRLDKRKAEIPPLSEATQSIAQNHFFKETFVE